MRRLFQILLGLSLLGPTVATAAAQELLKVAVPQRGSWDAGIPELGSRGGIFKKHGLQLEILYTSGGPESIQALIAGSVDIATASGVSAAFGTFAKGAPIRIIGSEIIGSPDLFWYVPANSPIQKIEDFNGKAVAYSLTGSSSHAALLALTAQYNLKVKPTSTGSIAATITQTMTGQVDVGWSAAPIGVSALEEGKIRIVARGNDVPAFADQTVRFVLANAEALDKRPDVFRRYMQAYRDTLDWMYADPASLAAYAAWAGVSESVARRTRDDFIPKDNANPDRISGLDAAMADAVAYKFLPAPLDAGQLKTLIRLQ